MSHPSPLHLHSTPPGSEPSSSDSDSEHSDIFHNNDNNMSTTTALVDMKAGFPEDFSVWKKQRCQAMDPHNEHILQYVQDSVHQQTNEAHSSQQDEQRMRYRLL